MDRGGRAILMVGIHVALSLLMSSSLRGQCREYELVVRDGLKAGQSLSIRAFSVNELAPYHYKPEPVEAVKEAMTTELEKSLARLNQFGEVSVVRDNEPASTDLILEGTISRLDEGNRARRMILPDDKAAAKMRVSGVIKRASNGETVMWFHCTSAKLGGLIGQGGLFTEGGKTLIHRCVKKIAADISKTVANAEQKPMRGKPLKKW